MSKKTLSVIFDYLLYIVGCVLFAFSVTQLLSPNEISPGGLAGIATLFQHLTSIPSGIALMAMNLPVLAIALFKFGGMFIVKTSIVTIFLSSVMTAFETTLSGVRIDPVLAAVFGGIGLGTGMSLIILRGATTGGVDIIAKLINRRFQHFTVGKIILILDAAVVLFAALVYRNIESALYSVLAIYASTRVMDLLLYGADKGKLIYIISQSHEKICSMIGNVLQRGVTVLKAKGGYTGDDRTLLMCVVRAHEVATIYRIVRECDSSAFVTVSEAGEILGEGFKPIINEQKNRQN
ncbi:MAG: YitT family protein [Ruminococcaceae bacterium]|nr:YitT family protein [Oscillospiraceae bacterium]